MGQHGGGPVATSLDLASQKENSQTPTAFTPGSILNLYQQPGYHPEDGNSKFDAQRQTPGGQLPSPNAQSISNWQSSYPSINTRLARS